MTNIATVLRDGDEATILILGDAMIEHAWTVGAAAETSQSHNRVDPRRVVKPEKCNVRPGGAALLASMLQRESGIQVTLLGSGGRDLRSHLENLGVSTPAGLLPDNGLTTTKFRIYADRGSKPPKLEHRFDLDIEVREFHEKLKDVRLPKASEVRQVVVSDFRKGIVSPETVGLLVRQYPSARWLVDSKDNGIVAWDVWNQLDENNRPVLIVNRDEFARLTGHALANSWYHLEPELLEASEKFHGTHCAWDLVVKLDALGAVAFWGPEGRDSWLYSVCCGEEVKGATAIGAGDAFMTGWAVESLKDTRVEDRLARAVRYASHWINLTEGKVELVHPETLDWANATNISAPTSLAVTDKVQKLNENRSLNGLLYCARKIRLDDAGGHCGRFMTLNPSVAKAVREFTNPVREYFDSKGHRRPLNCLIWAKPGSGKSFLAEELAREVGAHFREINLSSLAGPAELGKQLEGIGATGEEKVLVLLDEFMCQDGALVSRLIGTLWTKRRNQKVAFVLVDAMQYGKEAPINDVKAFIEELKKPHVEKGQDLVSRLNGPTLQLDNPEGLDRVILIASLIRRLHKDTAFAIERDALLSLMGKDTDKTWSPRAMEYIVESVTPSRGIIRWRDLNRVKSLCERLNVQLIAPSDAPSDASEHIISIIG